MSDGRKAAYEDAMENWYREKVHTLKNKDPREIIAGLERALQELNYFVQSQPALTESNHYRIRTARKILGGLLE